MKLSKHQKAIVKKIINGEIFDIQSYLLSFNKCHIEKYDMIALKKSFDNSENGKQYKVLKEGFSLFTNAPTQISGMQVTLPQLRLHIPEEECELKSAEFIDKAPEIKYTYDSTEYAFDFCEGVNIINNFNDVIDFLTLWSYLKQEALIIEVTKPISKSDIGLFFETISVTPSYKNSHAIKINNGKTFANINIGDVHQATPSRFAHEYSTTSWKINEDNLLMCQDFLNKKIIRTSALATFANKNFRTKEQVAQDSNYRVALIALIISILSILMGNIFPMFQKQSTEYLNDITLQISNVSSQLSEIKKEIINYNDVQETDLSTILSSIQEIETSIDAMSDIIEESSIKDISQELADIKQYILDIENQQ